MQTVNWARPFPFLEQLNVFIADYKRYPSDKKVKEVVSYLEREKPTTLPLSITKSVELTNILSQLTEIIPNDHRLMRLVCEILKVKSYLNLLPSSIQILVFGALGKESLPIIDSFSLYPETLGESLNYTFSTGNLKNLCYDFNSTLELLQKHGSTFVRLEIEDMPIHQVIQLVSLTPTLTSLNVESCAIGDVGFIDLFNNIPKTTLVSLSLSPSLFGQKPSLNTLQLINQCSNLTQLTLKEGNLAGLELAPIMNLTKLNTLTLYQSSLRETDITQLTRLGQLHSLNLSRNVIGRGINTIAQLSALTALDISYNPLTPDGARQLTQLKRLQTLNVKQCSLGDGQIAALALPSITSLDLSGNWISGNLTALRPLSRLKELNLSENNLNIWALNDLTFLPLVASITSLKIDSIQIGSSNRRGLLAKILNSFKNLISFSAQSCAINSGNMEGLRLTRLQLIDLSSNQVSTFSFMQNLPSLKEISLRGNLMKEQPVKRIESSFKNLEKIRLSSKHSAKSVIVPVPPDCAIMID